MTISVLVVDDSGFFRRRLGGMINSLDGLKVVGGACNGLEAIEMTLKLKPDVITMDYEMPMMDGITAVRHIMEQCPTPILMFSSLTHEGARVTLDSLTAGAVDYLPKNFDEISNSSADLKKKLGERLRVVAGAGKGTALKQSVAPVNNTESISESTVTSNQSNTESAAPATVAPLASGRVAARTRQGYEPRNKFGLVVIGTSTGGPVALQNVLTQLPANFPAPIVLVQHMPASFTSAFAERLNTLCSITVKEAQDGDSLRPGVVLLAPGGKQLMVVKGNRVKVLPGDERLNYKPCVDITFGSAANSFKGKVLAIILTGMGSDGCEGTKMLKQKGATVWAQDENTSVIYGMPMAIAKANLADRILPLSQVGVDLSKMS